MYKKSTAPDNNTHIAAWMYAIVTCNMTHDSCIKLAIMTLHLTFISLLPRWPWLTCADSAHTKQIFLN
jgi:hypothetical protein